jgi:CRP-like cAMP-binding protein
LVRGKVRMTKPGKTDWTFGDRSLIGAIDAILAQPHARTAIVEEPSHLLEVPAGVWLELLEDSFVMTQLAVQAMARRVDELRRRPPPLGGFDPAPARTEADAPPEHLVDRVLLLRDVPLFAGATTQPIVSLAALAAVRTAGAGEAVFPPGALKGALAVVAAGEVEASREGQTARFGRGALVSGSGALLGDGAWEVRATTPHSCLLVVRHEDYFDVMEEHFSLARAALLHISEEFLALRDRE